MTFEARRRPRALVQAERLPATALEAWRETTDALVEFGIQGDDWSGLVWNFESLGFDHLCTNSFGYSGLWQRAPVGGGFYVDQPGKTDPATQIRDCRRFWLDMIRTFKIEWFPTLGDFYCLNLAPAKVKSRVVYAGPGPYLDELGRPADAALVTECAAEFKARPRAYAAQAKGLDPGRKGWLAAVDFGAELERNRTPRLAAELKSMATLRGL